MVRTHLLRQGLRWSAGDVRRLRELAARKEPLRVIATKLGRTPQSVQWQADKRGIVLAREGEREASSRQALLTPSAGAARIATARATA